MNENQGKWLIVSIITIALYAIAITPTLISVQSLINAIWLAIKVLIVLGVVTFLACYP